jgi:hypothetical protein
VTRAALALALAVALTLLAGRAFDQELATQDAGAHLIRVAPKPSRSMLENRAARQAESYAHAKYVCRHGARANQRWHCAAKVWIRREWNETMNLLRPATLPTYASWVAVQMKYATLIAQASSRDPWPNCGDPFDGSGASWQTLVNCENGGSWYDSPGYYRCGIQADPMWERHYRVRFCP